MFGAGALMVSAQATPASADVPTERGVFRNKFSRQCLEVADWSQSRGAAVRQWPCTGGLNQRWYVRDSPDGGSGRKVVVNANSGMCLDAPGGNWGNGSQLIQWDCNGGLNQAWWIFHDADDNQKDVKFYSGDASNDQVMEISNFSTANGARAQMWEYNGGSNQLWDHLIG